LRQATYFDLPGNTIIAGNRAICQKTLLLTHKIQTVSSKHGKISAQPAKRSAGLARCTLCLNQETFRLKQKDSEEDE
jgi:hypothetical protein